MLDAQLRVALRLSGSSAIAWSRTRSDRSWRHHGDAPLIHPDWEGLVIDLAALWR